LLEITELEVLLMCMDTSTVEACVDRSAALW